MVDRHGAPVLKKVYDQAGRELDRKLRTLTRAGRSETMTAVQAHHLKAQVRQAQVSLSKQMAGALGNVTRDAQTEALRGVSKDVTRLEREFTGSELVLPIEEVSRFAGVIDQKAPSLLRMHRESMARYGVRTVGDFEEQLALSLASGETAAEGVDRLMDVYDMQWWQGERIVRTEVAWAFNATYADGLDEASDALPDLRKRWSEYVDDDTYEPQDDRVGTDSVAMHGQVAETDGVFTMPATAPRPGADGKTTVYRDLVGLTWEFPPNRPNDRAVVVPWRPHWGIPGWVYRDGRRVRV